MLIVYLDAFTDSQQLLLQRWEGRVHYWPRSYTEQERFIHALATDWWMLFHDPMYADLWLMKYSTQSRIVRTLFD